MTLIEALGEYAQREAEAWDLKAPPCDAIVVDEDNAHDHALNRILVSVFCQTLVQPTITHQIASLHSAAEVHEKHLAAYSGDILIHGKEPTVSIDAYQKTIETIRRWAQELHDHALEKLIPARAAG